MSSLYFREGLTINPYRHLINYIIKEKLNYNINLEEEEDEEEDNIVDLLANRSTKVGNLNYSRDLNLSSNTTKDLYNKSLKLCLDYFKYFNIYNYSLNDLENSLINNNNIAKVLKSSNISSLSLNNNILNTLNSFKSNNDLKLEEYLKDFFNNSSITFKDSYITKALNIVLDNKAPYLTYINKTGSGKSLLFLLPTFINKNIINIILTPRISLKDNLYKRAKESKLEAYILEDIILEDLNFIPLGLIISSIDSILNTNFNTYINILRKNNIELRIYLDEIHSLILEANYRPILKYINSLLKFKIPLIFISATLPDSLLNILNKEFFLSKEDNLIIKGITSRENISYNIVSYNSKLKEENNILDIIKIFKSKGLNSNNKALIFINSTKKGLALSKLLDIDFYYSNNPNKETILSTFLEYNNKSLVLLTTSALGLGVDFNIIRFTLHLTPLYSLLDYLQESSRIRDNGYSYILSNIKPNFNTTYKDFSLEENNISTIEEFKALDKAYINKLLGETKCLRRVINRFLDNNSSYIECNSNIESICSLCLLRQEKLNNKALIEENSLKEINIGLINLEEKLKDFNYNLCLLCLLEGPYKNYLRHTIYNCPNKSFISIKFKDINLKNLNYINIYIKDLLIKQSLLKEGTSCFTCLLPPRICSRLKEESNTSKCLYPNLVLNILSLVSYRLLRYKAEALYISNIPQVLLNIKELDPLIKELIGSTLIYKTNSIRIINIINLLNIDTILIKREDKDKEDNKIFKRPRTPPRIINNLIISPNPRDKKKPFNRE